MTEKQVQKRIDKLLLLEYEIADALFLISMYGRYPDIEKKYSKFLNRLSIGVNHQFTQYDPSRGVYKSQLETIDITLISQYIKNSIIEHLLGCNIQRLMVKFHLKDPRLYIFQVTQQDKNNLIDILDLFLNSLGKGFYLNEEQKSKLIKIPC